MKRIYQVIYILIFLLSFTRFCFAQLRTYRLTLKEATELAMANNFDIQLVKYDAWIAQTGRDKSRSIYDLIFSGNVGYQNNQSAVASTIAGTKAIDNDYDVGFSQLLPGGTTVDLGMTNNRSATNASFATNIVTYDSALKLTVVQDLGKNFFGIVDRGGIKTTFIDIENIEYTSLDKIEQYIRDVQKAYWSLVNAQKMIVIETDMLAEAKSLYDLNLEKIENGLVEKPELIASEVNYQTRLNTLLLAENTQQSQVNKLKLLLNIMDDDALIETQDNYRIPDFSKKSVPSLQLAFEQRQDYKQKHNELKKRNIELKVNKNKLWPEINLTASFAQNGLGTNFLKSTENITDQNNPDFFVGITLEIPLQNRSARADYHEAKLMDAQAILDLKYMERRISIEIVDKVRNVNILKEVAKNSIKIAQLQQSKLSEEKKRYNRGRSDTDTMIRFQEDVLEAKRQAITAQAAYQKAAVDLRKAEGSLLNVYWNEAL